MSARRPLLRGIRDKLLLAFTILVAGVAGFVLLFFPARLERQALQAAIATAETIRDMTAYSLGAGLYFGDVEAVEEVLDGAAGRADVRLLAVYDSAGRPFAVRGDVQAAPATLRAVAGHGAVSADAALYLATTPVHHGQSRIGGVLVGLSLAEVHEEVAAARRLGLIVAAVILVIGFLFVYAISTLVTRPLTAFSHTARRIAEGRLELRAVETADAEVAQLVRAFNHMMDRLAGAQAELAASNQQLEARVDARTAQLREAIAEQRRSQAALRQSEAQARATSEMLQSLIDVAPQAIVAVDAAWRVTRWNRAAEQLFGWSFHEVHGEPVPFLPPAERRAEALERAARLHRGASAAAEVTCLRRDGAPVSVLRSVAPLSDAGGGAEGHIFVLTDLTDRKSLEEQLRQSQKMEAIGRLAGGVAHDFNNILTVIKSSAALLLEVEQGEEARGDLEAIATAAVRAAALTRQLLLFSRKQVVQLGRVDVGATVRELTPMLRRLVRENIQLEVTDGAARGRVTADPSQLEQVIMNLVVNASDAMPDGGVLRIATDAVRLDELQARQHGEVAPGAYVLLVVSDTGIGMDAATVDRIFEPFFTTKPAGLGTGLGLATTYAVVAQLGGHIRVHSEPGHGTTFRIFLPLACAADGEDDASLLDDSAVGEPVRPVTVLLVEDEESVRRTIHRTLERTGYQILQACDGAQGLALAAAHAGPIDVLVTDLMMPGLTGRELADRLVAARPELRVVLMSGYTDATVNERWLADGGHVFLQKPFDGPLLVRTIGELLQDGELAVRG